MDEKWFIRKTIKTTKRINKKVNLKQLMEIQLDWILDNIYILIILWTCSWYHSRAVRPSRLHRQIMLTIETHTCVLSASIFFEALASSHSLMLSSSSDKSTPQTNEIYRIIDQKPISFQSSSLIMVLLLTLLVEIPGHICRTPPWGWQ